jgi:hypothetical protein
MIELTAEQRRAVEQSAGQPIDVIDPESRRHYVLIAAEQYRPAVQSPDSSLLEIPPGILRSQEAFWRDLPELLSQKKLRDQWVCYHGNERIGIAKDDIPLIRECIRRKLPEDSYYLGIICHHDLAPWETEEIEAMKPIHFGNSDDEIDGQDAQ